METNNYGNGSLDSNEDLQKNSNYSRENGALGQSTGPHSEQLNVEDTKPSGKTLNQHSTEEGVGRKDKKSQNIYY